MGEVYRATDTRLGRDVAIKILPDAFALDPERVARFKREAHVLASLNHPHIAQIYGIEESGPVRAIVMELVGGRTLAELIAGEARTNQVSGKARLDLLGRAADRAADRRGPCRGARPRDRSSRPEARQHQDHRRRDREGPGLRPGKTDSRRRQSKRRHCRRFPDADFAGRHGARPDSRHGRLHGARAGQGAACRQARGRLGVWLCAVRDVERSARL